jgi:iron complex transport system substrate-binding protein
VASRQTNTLGTPFTPRISPMRIVSLLPSATEMVCAAGAQAELVGVSHECDFPAGVEGLPTLTRTRTSLPKKSGDIDRAVREMLKDALAVYEVKVEEMRKAAPDVIVTQDLCDVCAVSLDDVRLALAELDLPNVQIISLKPTRLQDVWDDLRRVGEILGRAEQGEAAAQECERRAQEIAKRASAAKVARGGEAKRPTVLTIEWLDPIMVGGTWMPELVELAGGEALLVEPGQHSPTVGIDELSAINPDVVLIKPCGFELERTYQELELLTQRLPWADWAAVKEGRVFIADGNAYFNRPGPRLVESLEILAGCIDPETFADFRAAHVDSVRTIAADLTMGSFA